MTSYRTVWLALTAPASTSWDSEGAPQASWTARGDCRVVRVYLQLPTGSAGLLHIVPRIFTQSEDVQPILAFGAGGDGFLRGDNVTPVFDTDVPIRTGQRLQSWYDNQDDTNDHWFALAITLSGVV